MIKFTQTSRDRTVKVVLNSAIHIDGMVEGFIDFLRAIGYHESTIVSGLTSADIVENYLDTEKRKEEGV